MILVGPFQFRIFYDSMILSEYITQHARQLNRTENVSPALTECIIKYFLLCFPSFPSCTNKKDWKKEFCPSFSVLSK